MVDDQMTRFMRAIGYSEKQIRLVRFYECAVVGCDRTAPFSGSLCTRCYGARKEFWARHGSKSDWPEEVEHIPNLEIPVLTDEERDVVWKRLVL